LLDGASGRAVTAGGNRGSSGSLSWLDLEFVEKLALFFRLVFSQRDLGFLPLALLSQRAAASLIFSLIWDGWFDPRFVPIFSAQVLDVCSGDAPALWEENLVLFGFLNWVKYVLFLF
jgi:hypothetical protein